MTTTKPDRSELDRMNKLDLRPILDADGWEEADSSCASWLVVKRDGVKLILPFKNGAYSTYSNQGDDSDHGTAVNYVLVHRLGDSPGAPNWKLLGEVRKHLRPFLTIAAPGAVTSITFTKAVREGESERPKLSRQQVESSWNKMRPATECTYAMERGLSREILERYSSDLGCDEDGNLTLLHTRPDAQGIGVSECGWELRGPSTDRRFSTAGTRSLGRLGNHTMAKRMVVGESAIDCLSLAQIEKAQRKDTVYLSFGGNVTRTGLETLLHWHDQMASWCRNDLFPVELAHDNDGEKEKGKTGEDFARMSAAELLCRPGPRREEMLAIRPMAESLTAKQMMDMELFWDLADIANIRRKLPPPIPYSKGKDGKAKDWNDVLRGLIEQARSRKIAA